MKTSMIAVVIALAARWDAAAVSCIVDAGTEIYSRSTVSSVPGTLDIKSRSVYAETSEDAIETRFRTEEVSSAIGLDTSECGTVMLIR